MLPLPESCMMTLHTSKHALIPPTTYNLTTQSIKLPPTTNSQQSTTGTVVTQASIICLIVDTILQQHHHCMRYEDTPRPTSLAPSIRINGVPQPLYKRAVDHKKLPSRCKRRSSNYGGCCFADFCAMGRVWCDDSARQCISAGCGEQGKRAESSEQRWWVTPKPKVDTQKL